MAYTVKSTSRNCGWDKANEIGHLFLYNNFTVHEEEREGKLYVFTVNIKEKRFSKKRKP